MGLRTASVRRPHVEVMAPALTETTQTQNFKLPPTTTTTANPASPTKTTNSKSYETINGRGAYCKQNEIINDAVNNLQTLALASETLLANNTMSDSPSMGDQSITNMGLQRFDSISKIHENNSDNKNLPITTTNDVEQLFNNISTDLPQNVDDLMQVIKSIENTSPPSTTAATTTTTTTITNNDLEEFPVVNNLTSFEKFINDVDSMITTIDEQESTNNFKEIKSKELICDLKVKNLKIERRLDFLKRKIRKLQSRHMGLHISDEINGVFECVQRSLKRSKDEQLNDDLNKKTTIPSTKSMLKKLEMTAAMQANSTSTKQKQFVKYFGSGSNDTIPIAASTSSSTNNLMNIITPWPIEHKQELQKVAGMLNTELNLIQQDIDSEATESSSGGESCDELQNYNNPHQQYLSIQKRALWKYLSSRAAIAARWTWLQAQISDLEYRIRQHTDLHRQIRTTKGPVLLGGDSPPSPTNIPSPPPSPVTTTTTTTTTTTAAAAPPTMTVNGYRGQLPGNSPQQSSIKSIQNNNNNNLENNNVNNIVNNGVSTSLTCSTTTTTTSTLIDYQCARTRPLVNFKKRKLLQIAGLHVVSKKASRSSTIHCSCTTPNISCAICTGRNDPLYPRDPPEALSKFERIALVDPSFHPVFSLNEDVSCGVHCDAIMKVSEWQQRSTRMKSLKALKGDRSDKALIEARAKKLEHRKKYGRLLKPSTVSALSAKIKNKIRGRKINRHSSTSSSYRMNRKRNTSKIAMAQLQALVGNNNNNNTTTTNGGSIHAVGGLCEDEEIETIGNNIHNIHSTLASPSSSPLLHMQSISGYNRRNRINSYDIDNIVIPYSVAASTRVEKLQYKEILTPKWRIADPDLKCDNKNNGAVKNPSQDSDAEDLSDEAVIVRHDKCEYEEKKKFLSYLKLPLGYGRARSHKRTDSLAESSGGNTPDPMSPHPIEHQDINNSNSPLVSPPVTPSPVVCNLNSNVNNTTTATATATTTTTNLNSEELLPSVGVMRRRTMSQCRFAKERDNLFSIGVNIKEENNLTEHMEIPPFEMRLFPLEEDVYGKMLELMPENHQFKTNIRSQDSINATTNNSSNSLNYLDEKVDSPDTESTESAVGEEDPNDPEWVDMERTRDRHKR